jgi:16S rRNA (cytosine1402-N4)-methyltransferase
MSASPPLHVPVLLDEVLHWIDPRPGQTIVDGTLGGGGHTRALAERVGSAGRIIALDRDPAALAAAEVNLAGMPVAIAQADFCDLGEVLAELAIDQVDAVLLDIGLSSDQLADPARGFSFESDGPLDLRFDATTGEPAWRLLERMGADELADLIYGFGEERFSRRIARRIVECRPATPIRTARELAALVRRCVPRSRDSERIDPATRTFQALRIAVNHELQSLARALERIPNFLIPGGRLAVISFHSLEDRPVKEAFRDNACLRPLTKKPVIAGATEIARNPRARSAKLRVAEKIIAPRQA